MINFIFLKSAKLIRRILIPVFSFFLIFNLSAQKLLIDDPLVNGKSAGQIIHVNADDPAPAFTNEGWQPGASLKNQNHILYDVPFSFKEGYIEFEIKGMQDPVDEDYDPAFCALYDGRGIDEPIVYFDDFKKNIYRWNVHFRGDKRIFKCKIQMPGMKENKQVTNKAVFNSDADGGYSSNAECIAEPDGQPQEWSKTSWYKIKVEWRDKKYSVTVSDTIKWSVLLSCEYTPEDLRIWLGCAPGDIRNGKYTASIPGLTFRNFRLYTFDELK